ncbi:hypothetical protein OIV83_005733 [Microbotryomycetes sp. JL201]|nr:hypothetical protein OIV83_005733 [Microbotryomycetes sp. JL201]
MDPYGGQPHMGPSRSHHSSPLVGGPHHSYARQHMPPRAYPAGPGLESTMYGEPDGYGMPVSHPDGGHYMSPMLGHRPTSRGSVPGPPGAGYYTTAMLPGQDRMMPPGSRHMSIEPGHSGAGHSYTTHPHHHASTPVIHHSSTTPEPIAHHHMDMSRLQQPYGSSLKVIQWTPQHGEEGTQVTIILDALAINGAPATHYSLPSFGPGSPAMDAPRMRITRRFVVVFGQAPAPTKFTRAQAIDGNGVGQSMTAGPNEEDAFVVLTTFVPGRHTMGPLDERVMVLVRVIDEHQEIVEECIVGEWDPVPVRMYPSTPSRYRKRPGEELTSGRASPALRSPIQPTPSPRPRGRAGDMLSPPPHHTYSPGVSRGRRSGADDIPDPRQTASPDPGANSSGIPQPELLRTSQILPALSETTDGQKLSTYSSKAVLKLHGDLNQMAMGWSNEEWTNRRRLIQFWRQQEGNVINASFRPIAQEEYVPNTIVVSCIFRDEWNECFVTSVDTIYLLEALVGVRFSVEEKNRIRRNLEGFKPMTVSKTKADSEPFFKLIMGFPNPKPRNIEKDVKVFQWKVLSSALEKIIGKYSATYLGPASGQDSGDVASAPKFEEESQRASSVPGSGGFSVAPPSPAVPARIGGSLRNSPTVAHDEFSPTRSHGGMRPTHIMPPPASPIVGSRSQPTSPHVIQGPHSSFTGRVGGYGRPYGHGTSLEPPQGAVPHQQAISTHRSGHSRPGSFDFNSMLDTSRFGESNVAESASVPLRGDDGRSGAAVQGQQGSVSAPPDVTTYDDDVMYGRDARAATAVATDASGEHAFQRSWSEGPTVQPAQSRQTAPGSEPYNSYSAEYEAAPDGGSAGAGVSTWAYDAVANGGAPLRRSHSMEGNRPSSSSSAQASNMTRDQVPSAATRPAAPPRTASPSHPASEAVSTDHLA